VAEKSSDVKIKFYWIF